MFDLTAEGAEMALKMPKPGAKERYAPYNARDTAQLRKAVIVSTIAYGFSLQAASK